MKRLILLFAFMLVTLLGSSAIAGKPPKNARTKFYNFDELLIDGQIRKPTALYTDVRQRAKFKRLLRLKKSFLRPLFDTAKEKVFK